MDFSRRNFILRTAGYGLLALLDVSALWRGSAAAASLATRSFPRVRSDDNLFIAFNNIDNPENGESDEFTTIRNVQRVLSQMGVAQGSTVIGIGARTGLSSEDPFGAPGEMGFLWKLGDAWNASVTSPVDARPLPLDLDDPIPVMQVGVLHEETAHHFEIDDPSLEGSVLWTLYNDETGVPAIGTGMHNLFSDVDGGMLENIYKHSKEALANPRGWANWFNRQILSKYMPNLKDDRIWANFASTLGNPIIHSRWLPYVRNQGWAGAAVVLRGSMENVAQFHLREWVRKSPKEPIAQIGKGTHGFLKLKAGREVRPFITNAEGQWTMVGFIWDLDSRTSTPSMPTYQKFADIFGQDFHIHGFRDDGKVGGHTLFSALGKGKLSVSLYPLAFQQDESGFLFNNDLQVLGETLSQGASTLSVSVRNSGQNFVRNIRVQLHRLNWFGQPEDAEVLLIPTMAPGETVRVEFRGKSARKPSDKITRREVQIDREGRILEGGAGSSNNRLKF